MSFRVPDEEIEKAEEAVMYLDETRQALRIALDHLDIIYQPFDRYDEISTDSVVQKRGLLDRYQRANKKKFEKFKYLALMSIKKINHFSRGDAEIQEIVNSLESSAQELTDKVEKFYEALSNYQAEDFQDQVLEAINLIRSKSENFEDLVDDRIIEHINTNIIGKTWLHENQDKMHIEDKPEFSPLIVELYQERQQKEGLPSSSQEQQAMNPSDAQRVWHPDATRYVNFTEFQE